MDQLAPLAAATRLAPRRYRGVHTRWSCSLGAIPCGRVPCAVHAQPTRACAFAAPRRAGRGHPYARASRRWPRGHPMPWPADRGRLGALEKFQFGSPFVVATFKGFRRFIPSTCLPCSMTMASWLASMHASASKKLWRTSWKPTSPWTYNIITGSRCVPSFGGGRCVGLVAARSNVCF